MAKHRHKRETNARVFPRAALVAAPIAVLATVSAVTFGMMSADPVSDQTLLASPDSRVEAALDQRDIPISRSSARQSGAAAKTGSAQRADRAADAKRAVKAARAAKAEKVAQEAAQKATRQAVAQADTKLWTTATLNLWSLSGQDAQKVGLLDSGKHVLVTGRQADGREEVVIGGRSNWVTAGYLEAEKPVIASISGNCTNGTSVPSGVDSSIVAVHRAVCAAFPQITTYGTLRSDGEHSQGRAVDIMISGDTGWKVAEMLRANHAALGIEYLIYSQKIWSVERGGEGWRGMSNRGSTTANHYDHVHVTVY